MSVTWTEKWNRMVSTRSAERRYYGTSDNGDTDIDAYADLVAFAPSTLGGLIVDDVWVEEIEAHDDEWIGGVWYASAELGSLPPLAVGETRERFSTRGGQVKIKQSIDNIGNYGPGGAAGPNHFGAINVTDKGVEGVEIGSAAYTFSITKVFAAASITTAFKRDLIRCTYRVNNGTFKGLDAGECLFLGVEGGQRSATEYELDFGFAASENRTSFVVNPAAATPDEITVTAKKGWEFLWSEFATDKDTTVNRLIKKMIGAHIEKVYYLDDFSLLLVGT